MEGTLSIPSCTFLRITIPSLSPFDTFLLLGRWAFLPAERGVLPVRPVLGRCRQHVRGAAGLRVGVGGGSCETGKRRAHTLGVDEQKQDMHFTWNTVSSITINVRAGAPLTMNRAAQLRGKPMVPELPSNLLWPCPAPAPHLPFLLPQHSRALVARTPRFQR